MKFTVCKEDLSGSELAEQYSDMIEALFENSDVYMIPMDLRAGVRGDSNGDGKATVLDAKIALTYYTELLAGGEPSFSDDSAENRFIRMLLDVDGDGQITAEDAQYIMLYYVTGLVGYPQDWNEILPEDVQI